MKWSAVLVPVCLAGLSTPAASTCVCLCSVSAVNVAFGTYNPLPGTALDAAGSITFTCTISAGTMSYTAALSAGASGSYSPRQMSSGANRLDYNLYVDSARTTVWGDGSGGTQTQNGASTLGQVNYSQNSSVYGRILSNQTAAAPGSYSDSNIVVTVTYN